MTSETVELSDREQEILRLVATGASNKQIAQELVISINTVKVHLRNIFAKIGVNSRTEATLYAIREGMVPAPVGNLQLSEIDLDEDSNQLIEETKIQEISGLAGTDLQPGKVGRKWNRGVIEGILAVLTLILLGVIGVTQWQRFNSPTQENQGNQPRWQLKAPMPTARGNLTAAIYGDKIYVIGGEDSEGVSGETAMYIPMDDTWKNLPAKPNPVADVTAIPISGKIYVPGGRLATGQPTNVLEIYDPNQNQWLHGANLPIKVSAYAASAVDGKLYIFGGWDGANYLASVYEYIPDTDVWVARTIMPTPRAFAGAVTVGGKVFVIGGYDGKHALTANEVFSPEFQDSKSSAWMNYPPLPEGRYAMGMVDLLDNIYLWGGKNDPQVNNSVMIYTNQTKAWGNFNPTSLSLGWGLAAVSMNNQIYLFGGNDPHGFSNKVISYQAIYSLALPGVTK